MTFGTIGTFFHTKRGWSSRQYQSLICALQGSHNDGGLTIPHVPYFDSCAWHTWKTQVTYVFPEACKFSAYRWPTFSCIYAGGSAEALARSSRSRLKLVGSVASVLLWNFISCRKMCRGPQAALVLFDTTVRRSIMELFWFYTAPSPSGDFQQRS